MNQYEAMFVFDSTFANDYANVEKELQRIMERAEAEIIVAGKWDERKLAFDIKKRKRGCYVLVYFRARPNGVERIERDCQLSEQVLRVLILRADGVSRERMDQMTGHRAASAPSEHPSDEQVPQDEASDSTDSQKDKKESTEADPEAEKGEDTESEPAKALAPVDEEGPSS